MRVFFSCWRHFRSLHSARKTPRTVQKRSLTPQPVIMEHIGDSHSWPFAFPFVAEKHIPLPVILYTDKGIEIFSSANLMPEGYCLYQGNYYSYKLEENKIKAVDGTGKVDEAPAKRFWIFRLPVTWSACLWR